MLNEFLNLIGVKAPDIFAGFAGGVVRVALFGAWRSDPWGALGGVIAGTFSGMYLGPILPGYVGLVPNGGLTFIIGLAAMEVCQRLITLVTKWKINK